jgi:hypothetical protein
MHSSNLAIDTGTVPVVGKKSVLRNHVIILVYKDMVSPRITV